jgi:hypothetical protein
MVIILLIAALILIGVAALVVRNFNQRAPVAAPGRDRFRHAGPGEVRPKEPRAPGLD